MAWRKCDVWNCKSWHVRVFPPYCSKHDFRLSDVLGNYNEFVYNKVDFQSEKFISELKSNTQDINSNARIKIKKNKSKKEDTQEVDWVKV
jgi:hypothetical protein